MHRQPVLHLGRGLSYKQVEYYALGLREGATGGPPRALYCFLPGNRENGYFIRVGIAPYLDGIWCFFSEC